MHPSASPAPLTHVPSAAVEAREPPARPGCAPGAHTTRSRPRAAAAAAIKEKETKHHGKRSSPFKAPKTRQAHASLPLHSRVGGRRAKGRGVLFPPPRAPPHSAPPKFSWNLKVSDGKLKASRFPRAPRYPSTALGYFAFLKSRPRRPLPPSRSTLPIRAVLTKVRPFCCGRRPGPPRHGTRPAPAPCRWRARRSLSGHPLFPSPHPRRPTTHPGRRAPPERSADPARAQPPAESPRRKRSEKRRSGN